MAKKVFVSGCYDMLHSGHVAFFEEAAAYGDLYVGLGSDRTVFELKNRKCVNPEEERLYMVRSIRFVKDAWINSGSGIMDFEKEVLALEPDIFFVNSDGFTPRKEEFCKEHNIELIVSQRKPHGTLPARSTTALRQVTTIPYRVELCGGWMDQEFINSIAPGPVLTVSIHPDHEFNNRSGMGTSSRFKAIELWSDQLPSGDPQILAKTLYHAENPPGKQYLSGSQDQLGMLLPGLNKLNYDHGFWPVSIESVRDEEILRYVEDHLYLVQLGMRKNDYDVYGNISLEKSHVERLAASTENAWKAILAKDTLSWGRYTRECFEAQCAIFPNMATDEVLQCIDRWKDIACGWKLSGAGGGGYLILISEHPVENAIKVSIRS